MFSEAVVWESPVTSSHTDSQLTSEDFSVDKPAEIGVHVFYDQPGSNKKFFDDFGFLMGGYSSPGSGGSQIQY